MNERALAICDLNGDRMRAMEWAMASLRAFGDLSGDQEIWHPADCIGDSGAASGALSLAWGAATLAREEAGANAVVAWGASDGPLRGAALLLRLRTGSSARADSRSSSGESSWD
jgi:3-oxoacyl-[acyl-carrier-protein] synthase-1